jgi:HD-GYP domain-containing protein (c-di-GMP phosphodiesterase class II)
MLGKDNAGTQFDPEVVEALLAVLARTQPSSAAGGKA